jgi:hypothetical protein
MTTASKHESNYWGVVVGALVVALISTGVFPAIESYFKKHTSHNKLTAVVYHGDWSIGEYRECHSANSNSAELNCPAGFTISDIGKIGKIFNVEFVGDVTYDEAKSDDVTHHWLCRRNNDDPSFYCLAREIPQAPSSQASDSPPPTVERHLSPDEIEYFRKRNECENRFYDKKIYEVDGMSIGPACKQNPDRRP